MKIESTLFNLVGREMVQGAWLVGGQCGYDALPLSTQKHPLLPAKSQLSEYGILPVSCFSNSRRSEIDGLQVPSSSLKITAFHS